MSPEIQREARFSLHIYRERGAQHKLAHVHVRRRDGSSNPVLSLPLLMQLAGPPPTKEELEACLGCLQKLVDAWDACNG